ncbi:MAG UNVERIFIED_CONTAM: EamA family transporter [Rickettsiaceae bacterium]|jgi:drug/metabolite transporter (DMT)-like permease
MVFNCLIAASVPIIIKYTSNDFALSSIVAAYHLIATILSIVIILYCKISVKTRFLHLHMLRSVLSTSAYFLYFYALSITSIANAIALAHTDAILTCLFASFFFKRKNDSNGCHKSKP